MQNFVTTRRTRGILRNSQYLFTWQVSKERTHNRETYIYSKFSHPILDGSRGVPCKGEKLPSHELALGLSGNIKIENRRRNDITTPRPHELYSPSHEHYQVLFCTSPRTLSGIQERSKARGPPPVYHNSIRAPIYGTASPLYLSLWFL